MKITRGDTHSYYFQRKRDKQPITVEAENIYFTVKENSDTKKMIFQKTIDDMDFDENYYYHFTVNPEDTNELDYGDYVYDIEVKIDTYTRTISKGIFSITDEVTHKENEV